eukprot:9753909-Ditylum_brightwellii.AAC.1
MRNASTLKSTLGGGNNGLAGLCEFPAVYLAQTGHNSVRPPYPGDFPVHPKPQKPQHSPFKAPLPTFGKDSQNPTDHHIAPAVSKEAKLRIPQIMGSLLTIWKIGQ